VRGLVDLDRVPLGGPLGEKLVERPAAVPAYVRVSTHLQQANETGGQTTRSSPQATSAIVLPMAPAADVAIALTHVSKSFGGHRAVDDVTLEIAEGEFFSLLGPSGCGKTTTLRMIAGFESPDAGEVVLQGADVTKVPANRRPVNMVFQQYALFPHMTIYDNVAFGLKAKRVPREEHAARIAELLRVVSLEGYEQRKPKQLSGGQQQRVALARALVNRPAALLLDEPLGALDVKLRKQMQLELKRIQHELGTTFVYVTHDQDEALAMSDRIAVMNHGKVEQLGSPREIYEQPRTAFVADFIGSLNTLDVRIDELVGAYCISRLADGGRVIATAEGPRAVGETVRVGVRPEHVQLSPVETLAPDDRARLTGTIADLVYLGMYTQFHVDTAAGRIVSHRLAGEPAVRLEAGARVSVTWPAEHAAVVD
jgi:spermidine/putrescine transport system ATP-binding protein